MLNMCKECIELRRDVIWINKVYGEYVSRKEHNKDESYILHYEDKSDKWDYIKTILSRLKKSNQTKSYDQAGF